MFKRTVVLLQYITWQCSTALWFCTLAFNLYLPGSIGFVFSPIVIYLLEGLYRTLYSIAVQYLALQ